ncbi:thioredoxin family protein [Rufibacter latericius]|uniref:Thioredoxin n=1 Tax=Rufibacter latericius TaxID=2487040 RepID=A0A3M9MK01_9BACT|nr:thioredoxin family protein [Rufibacter latericius]RNI25870.1 thioredoxin [Rufibacter latericius]
MHFRLFLLSILALGVFSCARQATSSADQSGYSALGQTGLDANKNREEKDKSGNGNILIGSTNRAAFENAPYSTWFHPAYQRYTPNQKIMDELVPLLENVTVKGYMGSWCEDSQRDIPRFYKVLDFAHFPHSRFNLISLREDKSGFNGEEKADNITAVPTFILYREGKEVGRIVETAYPTLEMNMLTILKGDSTK